MKQKAIKIQNLKENFYYSFMIILLTAVLYTESLKFLLFLCIFSESS